MEITWLFLISGVYQPNFHIKRVINVQNLNFFPRGGQRLRLKNVISLHDVGEIHKGEPSGINRQTWQLCHHRVNKATGLKECKLAVDVSADKQSNSSSVWSYCCPLKENMSLHTAERNTQDGINLQRHQYMHSNTWLSTHTPLRDACRWEKDKVT